MEGAEALLECNWRAEGFPVNDEGLYSLKWYHGLHEFYRWTPSERSPMQVLSVSKEAKYHPKVTRKLCQYILFIYIKRIFLGYTGNCLVKGEFDLKNDALKN